MEGLKVLLIFLERIQNDPFIDTGHIAVFLALFNKWVANGCNDSVKIRSREIMNESKISSSATYFKKIRELSKMEYIEYFPNNCSLKGTWVNLDINYH